MASRGVFQSLGDLFFTIAPDMSMFQSELTKGLEVAAAGSTANIGAAMENLGMEMMKKFTAPLAVATAANIAQFQALDREIRSVLTLFDTAPALLDEAWDRMSAGITQVSRDVGGLEKDIADGLYQAISAGVPEEDVFAFLDVAQMAAIADKTSDLTTAVDAITTMTNSFSAEALDAAAASDILFAAVAQGKTTFGELGASIGRASGTAANAGVKATEFAASIATITQTGIQTSEAVSYLRASITGLLRPSEEMDAIFEQLGFSSAEAAVPIIGLQPAFQAVVDASGGSISKLQELIGTAEGVSAILSITGEKSDAFAKSLSATEKSAGATARAFKIVDAGVGRSFGKLTESFDRLGNYFGKLGARIVQPFIDFVTEIVNGVYDVFKQLEPAFDAVIDGVLGILSVFNNPGFKKFATTIVSIAIAFGGVLGIIAPFIFGLGKVIIWITKLLVIKTVTKTFNQFRDAAVTSARVAGRAYDKLADVIKNKVVVANTTLGKAAGKAGKALASTVVKAGALGVAFAAVAVAVGLAIYALDKYKKSLEQIDRQTSVIRQGVDRMAESLGITLTAIGEVDFDELNGEAGPTFVMKNEDVLQQFTRYQEEYGDDVLREQVIAFSLELLNRDATEKEVLGTIEQIESALGGIDLKIDLADIIPEAAIDGVLGPVLLAVQNTWDTYGDQLNINLRKNAGALTNVAKGDLRNAADALARIYQTQGYDKFVEGLQAAQYEVRGLAGAQNYLADEVLIAFERMNDREYDFDISGTTNLNESLLELQTKVSGFTTATVQSQEEINKLANIQFKTSPGADPTRFIPTPAQLETQRELIGGISDVFIEAEQHIASAFTAIQTGLTNSMPGLEIYTGAVKQSFDEWKKGQDQFQTDIVKVAEFREQLKGLAPEVVGAFDESGLDKQTWLANLGAEEQAEAIAEMAESYGAVTDAVDITWKQEVPGVIQEAQGIIESHYATMYGEALTAGGQTGVNFAAAFNDAAAQWPGIASYWMGQVAAVIGGGDAGAVSLGGPEIQATFNVTNNAVTVTSTTPNPGRQVTGALQRSQFPE